MSNLPGSTISAILRHDSKVTSYKIALLRAINDVVLAFPDLASTEQAVAIPRLKQLRIAARSGNSPPGGGSLHHCRRPIDRPVGIAPEATSAQ